MSRLHRFVWETAGALTSGVSTVVDLPTTTSATWPEVGAEKRSSCKKLAYVDFDRVDRNIQAAEVDVTGIASAETPDFKMFSTNRTSPTTKSSWSFCRSSRP